MFVGNLLYACAKLIECKINDNDNDNDNDDDDDDNNNSSSNNKCY